MWIILLSKASGMIFYATVLGYQIVNWWPTAHIQFTMLQKLQKNFPYHHSKNYKNVIFQNEKENSYQPNS